MDGVEVANDNETLDLGGLTLRFLHVGGHAIGNIVVHVPDLQALMASDSLGFRIPSIGFFPIFFTGYADYMATIDRLETLEPRILCLAHQGPLVGEDARKAFRDAREAARSLYEEIRNDPRDEDAMIADLNRRFYREELTLYTPENIIGCCRLIIRRSRAGRPDSFAEACGLQDSGIRTPAPDSKRLALLIPNQRINPFPSYCFLNKVPPGGAAQGEEEERRR